VVLLLRSTLFAIAFYGTTAAMALAGLPVFLFLSERRRLAYAQAWARAALAVLRIFAGIRVEIRGREHIPQGPALIAAKHQSALETFALLPFLAFPALVMKIELRRIPLFGFYSVAAGMILVDREKGGSALRDMVRRGREEAAKGRQVVIFPEGTRRPPGAPPAYQGGVVLLYRGLGLATVPVALNSGLFWPRRSFLKYPGTVVIEFLPPVAPGLDATAFMAVLKGAIEDGSNRLIAEAAAAPHPPPIPAAAKARLTELARS
jgi:1-acyl-sn-glycerol-3-phosphate acyltransferase